jgi:hypothetical protein
MIGKSDVACNEIGKFSSPVSLALLIRDRRKSAARSIGCLDVRHCEPRRIYGDAAVEAVKMAATVCGVNLDFLNC